MARKKVKIKILVLDEKYKPEFKVDQEFSNCMDLKACLPEKDYRGQNLQLWPGEVATIRTGVKLELPEGYEGVIRPRSGLSREYGIMIVNSPGTVDTGYRGELMIVLSNIRHTVKGWGGPDKNRKPYLIKDGDRIAQLGIREVPLVSVEYVEEISETKRGAKGFGSTGK